MPGSGPVVEHLDAIESQRVWIEHESIALSPKGNVAAVHGAALRLVLRALIEPAEPAAICAGSVEKEDVDLMVSNADLLVLPELAHRAAAQDPQPLP